MIIFVDLIQSISLVLVLVFLFLGFKLLETNWSYKISKPYAWEAAVKENRISSRLKKTERRYRDKVRFYTIWFQVERIKEQNIAGAFAELGVYKGETARFIHEMDNSRKFYLFDTFQGFDQKDLQHEISTDEKYSTANFADTTLNDVKKFIEGNENLIFIPGYFPESIAAVNESRFAFVHLDADLYQPTIAALNYFYPRLSPGGVIIIHDYNHNWPGLRKAVDEFRKTIPESLLEISDWQGSVMFVKNLQIR